MRVLLTFRVDDKGMVHADLNRGQIIAAGVELASVQLRIARHQLLDIIDNFNKGRIDALLKIISGEAQEEPDAEAEDDESAAAGGSGSIH